MMISKKIELGFIMIILFLVLILALFISPQFYLLISQYLKIFYRKWSKKINNYEGLDFLFSLSGLEQRIDRGEISFEFNLPEYKFYTSTVLTLIADSKKRGIRIGKYLRQLKELIKIEVHFDRKLKNELISGPIQFLAISLATWSFIYFSNQMMEIKLSKLHYFCILFLQLCGLFTYYFSIKKLELRMFKIFESSLKSILLFQSYHEVGYPVNELLNYSKINSSSFFTDNFFGELKESFLQSFERLKNSGKSMKDDLESIRTCIFDMREDRLIKFYKNVGMIKFLHLCFLYLPAYFIYILSMFKFFVEQ